MFQLLQHQLETSKLEEGACTVTPANNVLILSLSFSLSLSFAHLLSLALSRSLSLSLSHSLPSSLPPSLSISPLVHVPVVQSTSWLTGARRRPRLGRLLSAPAQKLGQTS